MSELSPEQRPPLIPPEQLTEKYAAMFSDALNLEAHRIMGSPNEGAVAVTQSFLETNAAGLPVDQTSMLSDSLSRLRSAHYEKDGEEATSAFSTMRKLIDASDSISRIVQIAEETDPAKKVDSSAVARWLKEDVLPLLVDASRTHEAQSEVVMHRYRETLPDEDRRYFPATYERIKPLQ